MARIFLSHASADKPTVRRLRDALADAGHRPWLDEDEILCGDSIPEAIERALTESDYLVWCLSSQARRRGWVQAERYVASMDQAAQQQARILPVRLEDVAVPKLLTHLKYIDLFSDSNWARGVQELIESIEGHEARRQGRRVARPRERAISSAGVPTARSAVPAYKDEAMRSLSQRLEAAQARKRKLTELGHHSEDLVQEILQLKRQLREGGQVAAGDTLGDDRYVLLRRLGRGGFASVWEAEDRRYGDHVAIKVMHPNLAQDPKRRERFFRGARVMSELAHESVVRVREPYGEDGGYYYFAMELVTGGTLYQAVVDGRVSSDQAVPLMVEIGRALAAAHARGVVHRDVKPANILLTESGEAKLTDFDLVAAGDTTGGTRTGAMGTFLYAPPEMMDRPQDATARADVYGLAMTGVFIYHGAKLPPTVMRDAGQFIDELVCPGAIKRILTRALDWEVSSRHANAQELCDDLARVLQPVAPEPEPSGEKDKRRERPAWLFPGLAVAGVATVAAVAIAWPGGGSESGPDASSPVADAGPPVPLDAARPVPDAGRDPGAMQFIHVPGGEFMMGSPTGETGHDKDEVQHRVKLSGFEISETEVTQGQWKAVMGDNPSHCYKNKCADQLPVQNVSWNDAIEFLNRLSRKEGKQACYDTSGKKVEWKQTCDGYRLPTEAEWEYACRAGSKGAYSFGDDVDQLSEYAIYDQPWDSGTKPVKSYKPNAWGLYDMHGNVWEWTWDWYGAYKTEKIQTDPRGPPKGEYRTVRGGSFRNRAWFLRCVGRNWIRPVYRDRNQGFRVVRDSGRQPSPDDVVVDVSLKSVPTGANVEVLGTEFTGTTPATFKLVEVRSYTVRYTLAGYKSQEVTIEPALDARPPEVELTLVPMILRLTSTPPGALVYVDGRRVHGQTPNEFELPDSFRKRRRFKIAFRLHGHEKLNITAEATDFRPEGEAMVQDVNGVLVKAEKTSGGSSDKSDNGG